MDERKNEWMDEWTSGYELATLFIKRNSLVETASHTGHYSINIVNVW